MYEINNLDSWLLGKDSFLSYGDKIIFKHLLIEDFTIKFAIDTRDNNCVGIWLHKDNNCFKTHFQDFHDLANWCRGYFDCKWLFY